MATPLLTIWNNHFHPALTKSQQKKTAAALVCLEEAQRELDRAQSLLDEVNQSLKDGGIKLQELDFARSNVHAYRFIVGNTLQLSGVVQS